MNVYISKKHWLLHNNQTHSFFRNVDKIASITKNETAVTWLMNGNRVEVSHTAFDYGFSEEEVAFLNYFSSPQPGFEEAARRVIELGLPGHWTVMFLCKTVYYSKFFYRLEYNVFCKSSRNLFFEHGEW